MEPSDWRQWLALHAVFGEATAAFRRALAMTGPEPSALAALSQRQWTKLGASQSHRLSLEQWRQNALPPSRCRWLDHSVDWCLRRGVTLLVLGQPEYPASLAAIPDPPPLLYVLGSWQDLTAPQLAVVGSRKASPMALKLTRDWVTILAAGGLLITSGLALGVDSAAHQAALAAGGCTIAVMATGIDRVYPQTHWQLAAQICTAGCLVSEFLPGTAALAHRFPRRNRIIAGLSLGTLVTEAAARSGSLITALAALEQGREVMAVPQPVAHAGGAGCNELLRAGATLVCDPSDVACALAAAWPAGLTAKAAVVAADIEAEPPMLSYIGFDVVSADSLAERAACSGTEALIALTELELSGWVARCPGGFVRCR
jgi:DNA processing protein